MITLRFSGGTSPGARLIQAATWSWASHVDFELEDGRVLGAVPGAGVSIRDIEIGDARVERYGVDLRRAVVQELVIGFAHSQLGRPYDWAGILGYGFRRDWQEADRWFCSELVAWAFARAHRPLVRAEDVWRITPRDLLLSPYLIPLVASAGGGRGAATPRTARGHLA